jgi:hypothetical protein
MSTAANTEFPVRFQGAESKKKADVGGKTAEKGKLMTGIREHDKGAARSLSGRSTLHGDRQGYYG